MEDLDEPPVKIKKENENNDESANLLIKEEIIDVNDSEDTTTTTPLVNHRVRVLPSWLQLPNTSAVNEESNNAVSKQPTVDISDSDGTSTTTIPVVNNHQVRPLPSWLKLPNAAEMKVKTEPEDAGAIASASKPIKTEPQTDENAENPLGKINAIFVNGVKTEKPDENDRDSSTTSVKTEDPITPNKVAGSPPCTSANNGSINDDVSSSIDVNQKPPCRYGSSCYRMNANHRQDFSHPPGSDPSKSPQKPMCKYGTRCYRKNDEHRKRFVHPRSPDNALHNQQRLRNVGSQTYRFSDDSDDNDSYGGFSTDATEDEFHVSDEEDGSETDFEEDEIGTDEDEAEA